MTYIVDFFRKRRFWSKLNKTAELVWPHFRNWEKIHHFKNFVCILNPGRNIASATNLWKSCPHPRERLVFASFIEEISVKLGLPAHHLLALPSYQQLVKEQRVGEDESAILRFKLEIWLRCRERLRTPACRTHIFSHTRKTSMVGLNQPRIIPLTSRTRLLWLSWLLWFWWLSCLSSLS